MSLRIPISKLGHFCLVLTIITSIQPSPAEALNIRTNSTASCAGKISELGAIGFTAVLLISAFFAVPHFGHQRSQKLSRQALFEPQASKTSILESVSVDPSGNFQIHYRLDASGKKKLTLTDAQGFITMKAVLYALTQDALKEYHSDFLRLKISETEWLDALKSMNEKPVEHWDEVSPLLMATLQKIQGTLENTSGPQAENLKRDAERIFQMHRRILIGERQPTYYDLYGYPESFGSLLKSLEAQVSFSFQVDGQTFSTSQLESLPPPLDFLSFDLGSFPPASSTGKYLPAQSSVLNWQNVSEVK